MVSAPEFKAPGVLQVFSLAPNPALTPFIEDAIRQNGGGYRMTGQSLCCQRDVTGLRQQRCRRGRHQFWKKGSII
jgi:hypothetical protein